MFQPRPDAPAPSQASLQGLRLSLNTPVVSIEELPEGPARAAIVLETGADGSLQLAVVLRSLRAAGLVSFVLSGEIDPQAVTFAWDAALNFGEGLGFLFDDDALAGGTDRAREAGLALWQSFSAGADAGGPVPARAVDASAFGDAPLELDPEPHAELEVEAPEPQAAAPAAPPALSKFRDRPGAAPEAGSASALGRVPIVKLRAEPEDLETAHALLHVLAGF
jgi:hypothetical protein